jgi:hypothetical protein
MQHRNGWTETLEGTVTFRYVRTHLFLPYLEEEFELESGTLTWSAGGGCAPHAACSSVSGGPLVIDLDPGREGGREGGWVRTTRRDGTYLGALSIDEVRLYNQLFIAYPDEETSQGYGTLDGIVIGSADSLYHLSEDRSRMQGTFEYVGSVDDVLTHTWNLTNVPEVLDLVVEVDPYDEWLPLGGPDEQTRGSVLSIRARLQNADGTPTTRTAIKMTFELVDGTVSREPGVALNYPSREAATDDYDLRFEGDLNPAAEISNNGLRAVVSGEQLQDETARLSAFDFGAYGVLRVTAETAEGQMLVGKLAETEETEILLPKRRSGSFVADHWLQSHNAVGLPDDDDTDPYPVGDGHGGDGLSLYEEYRGFVQNGEHFRGDPNRKDFFIRDTIGGRTKAGIALFARATDDGRFGGLNVHHEFLESEWDATNVINFNARTHHLVDQHGIYVIPGSLEFISRVNALNGQPGLPRNIESLELSQSWMRGLQSWSDVLPGVSPNDYYDATTAHELGHTVNVWHHGERDRDGRWSIQHDDDGSPLQDDDGFFIVRESLIGRDGNPHVWGHVELRLESGTRVLPRRLQRHGWMMFSLGLEHGQHSGDDSCVMRYVSATGYPLHNSSVVRYVILDSMVHGQGYGERPGNTFCTSPDGTGVNHPSRTTPKPRYGDADYEARFGPAQRGNCLHRVCVNDRLADH